MATINITGSNGKTFAIKGGSKAPEDNAFGSVGDLYIYDKNGAGTIWQKQSGNNTKSGWMQLATGTSAALPDSQIGYGTGNGLTSDDLLTRTPQTTTIGNINGTSASLVQVGVLEDSIGVTVLYKPVQVGNDQALILVGDGTAQGYGTTAAIVSYTNGVDTGCSLVAQQSGLTIFFSGPTSSTKLVLTDTLFSFQNQAAQPILTIDTTTNKVAITDGTQALGNILTSDANGVSSWETVGTMLATNAYQYAAPTTGSTVTSNSRRALVLNPAGSLATLTIAFPSSPVSGQTFAISTSQTIASITLTGASFPSGGSLSALSANSSMQWRYISEVSLWFKMQN